MSDQIFMVLADVVLTLHVGFVVFVVAGLLLIYLGYFLQWSWVRNRVFRVLHLLAIGVVVIQSWLGIVCPLTTLEMWLRAQAGEITYAGSFIQHWMQQILYFDAPWWVFTAIYTAFASLVIVSWLVVRPNSSASPFARQTKN